MRVANANIGMALGLSGWLMLVGCSDMVDRSITRPIDPKKELVCENNLPTGSKIAERRCITKRQSEEERADAQAILREAAKKATTR